MPHNAEPLSVDEIVRNVSQIASAPEVALRAYRMLRDPFFSAVQVGQIIRLDPGLTAQVLRVANSVYYSPRKPVETVPHAIAMIGAPNVRALLISVAASASLNQIAPPGFQLNTFWQHSVYAALVADHLAAACLVEDREPLFVAGLLHDVGRILLFQQCPEVAVRLLNTAIDAADGQWEIEHGLLGFTHADVGAALLRRWQLPEHICEPVGCHHEPALAKAFPLEAAIAHIANHAANVALRPEMRGLPPAERDRRVAAAAWSVTGLDSPAVDEALAHADGHFGELGALLAGHGQPVRATA